MPENYGRVVFLIWRIAGYIDIHHESDDYPKTRGRIFLSRQIYPNYKEKHQRAACPLECRRYLQGVWSYGDTSCEEWCFYSSKSWTVLKLNVPLRTKWRFVFYFHILRTLLIWLFLAMVPEKVKFTHLSIATFRRGNEYNTYNMLNYWQHWCSICHL